MASPLTDTSAMACHKPFLTSSNVAGSHNRGQHNNHWLWSSSAKCSQNCISACKSDWLWPSLSASCNITYSAGAHSAKATQANVTAVRRASVLCYMPQDLIPMGIAVIEADVGETVFGKRFIKYWRTTWMNRSISIHDERIRNTNGSETFHWRVQRVHNRAQNNINQFLTQLRTIESMCAVSISQFHKCILSKQQQMTVTVYFVFF